MKRFFFMAALLLISACSFAQPKEIKTVAILGDSYSTFDGYIPEGNACWYFTTPQGENDVVSVEQTWCPGRCPGAFCFRSVKIARKQNLFGLFWPLCPFIG